MLAISNRSKANSKRNAVKKLKPRLFEVLWRAVVAEQNVEKEVTV